MCNEKNNTEHRDQRFLEYRLDQLEKNLTKNLEKLEKENNQHNKEILQTLQIMQEGINEQNKTLIQHNTEIQQLKEEIDKLDGTQVKLKEAKDRIHAIEDRLQIYQKVLITIAAALGGAIVLELMKIL